MRDIQSIVCISYTKKNRKLMNRLSRKKDFAFKFYYASHKLKASHNYKALCHLEVIAQAKRSNYKNILILEDTIDILAKLKTLFTRLPTNDDWSMLYLGGELKQILDTEEDHKLKKNEKNNGTEKTYWRRAQILGTYGYIVKQELYDTILLEGKKWLKLNKGKSLELFYSDIIHTKYKCYLTKYPLVVLRGIQLTPDSLYKVPIEKIETDTGYIDSVLKIKDIKDEELPFVSLITPITYNNPHWFFLTLTNFFNLEYPPDKLEWLILDEKSIIEEDYKNYLKNDSRVTYYQCNEVNITDQLSLGQKLNSLCGNAKGDIIIHFFEQNYYLPSSLISRVKILMSYPDYQCIGSTELGCYNLKLNQSLKKLETDHCKNMTILQEPTMAYTKDFWKYLQYEELIRNDNHKNIVSIPFLANRYSLIMDIPYEYICINITISIEPPKVVSFNFYDTWSERVKECIDVIREELVNQTQNDYLKVSN